jgi:hypothetical protein
MVKQLLCTAALGVSFLVLEPSWAHDDPKPNHGGIVQVANDLSFELVSRSDGVVIYVADHGKPMATNGMTGKLTVLNGAQRTEAALVSVGDRLEAKGIKLGPGAKVVAAVTTPGKKALTVRFSVK